jgi:hypothetical protein
VPVDVVSVAAAALAQPVASAHVTTRTPVGYDPYLAGRDLEWLTGDAQIAGGVTRSWSAVVKRTTRAGMRAARRGAVAAAALRGGGCTHRDVGRAGAG